LSGGEVDGLEVDQVEGGGGPEEGTVALAEPVDKTDRPGFDVFKNLLLFVTVGGS
jgi:hypothetical protein